MSDDLALTKGEQAEIRRYINSTLGGPEVPINELPTWLAALLTRALEAERKLAELRERTRWIPVNERLPEVDSNDIGQEYNVMLGGVFYRTAALYFRQGEWYSSSGSRWTGYVTHWQPLPVPPEAENA